MFKASLKKSCLRLSLLKSAYDNKFQPELMQGILQVFDGVLSCMRTGGFNRGQQTGKYHS